MTARLYNRTELEYPWLKNRGYPHVTPHLDLATDRKKILSMLKNEKYIAKYAFFPLIHSILNERRYKRISPSDKQRAHSFSNEKGENKRNIKSRPLHYATHLDAIIFGYYADILYKIYEAELFTHMGLSDCVTAYRRIPLPDGKNKSTIHFAHEAFSEIKARAEYECEVLKFDIKSFFSRINHQILKETWARLLGEKQLPDDHYNVFKAATRFCYIMKDDFRLKSSINGKRAGFDEKRLAQIRKRGIISYFESVSEFRNSIKNGNIKLHKYPFKDEAGNPVGIPQGLPISAVLANLYLLDFDLKILKDLVEKLGVFYRRYSDDIIVICRPDQANYVEDFINSAISSSKVEMSKDKTERFLFKTNIEKDEPVIHSYKIAEGDRQKGIPFSYLGFEYYGNKTLIKSANLSRFYRRMIRAVKSKAKRAVSVSKETPGLPIVIYKRQLYKLYTKYPLTSTSVKSNFKRLLRNDKGEFHYKIVRKNKPNNSNYLSYAHRASEIMGELGPKLQIRNHTKIFNQAIHKHLQKAIDSIT